MRSRDVEILPSFGDGAAGMVKAEEQAFVQKLVAHPAVEALDMAVLHRLSRREGVPFHTVILLTAGDRRVGDAARHSRVTSSTMVSTRKRRPQLLLLRVLVFQGLQAFGVGHVHAATLRLTIIQRRFRNPVLAGQVARLRTRLVPAQNRDDLIFREPLPFHLSALQARPDSNSRWRKNAVAGQL